MWSVIGLTAKCKHQSLGMFYLCTHLDGETSTVRIGTNLVLHALWSVSAMCTYSSKTEVPRMLAYSSLSEKQGNILWVLWTQVNWNDGTLESNLFPLAVFCFCTLEGSKCKSRVRLLLTATLKRTFTTCKIPIQIKKYHICTLNINGDNIDEIQSGNVGVIKL